MRGGVRVEPRALGGVAGLFTIIVIGKTVVVSALGVDDWRTASALVASAGLALVCAVWWLHFDRQQETHLRPTIRPDLVFIYGHAFAAAAAPLAPLVSMLAIVAVVGGLAAAGRLARPVAQR